MGTRGSEQGFARKERGLKGVGVHARREARARERDGLSLKGKGGRAKSGVNMNTSVVVWARSFE